MSVKYKQKILENCLDLHYLKKGLGTFCYYELELKKNIQVNKIKVKDFFDSFKETEFELKKDYTRDKIVLILKRLHREIIEKNNKINFNFEIYPIFSILKYDYYEETILYAFNENVKNLFQNLIENESLRKTIKDEKLNKLNKVNKNSNHVFEENYERSSEV